MLLLLNDIKSRFPHRLVNKWFVISVNASGTPAACTFRTVTRVAADRSVLKCRCRLPLFFGQQTVRTDQTLNRTGPIDATSRAPRTPPIMSSFIPCVKWVKQGVSSHQNTVELSKAELKELTEAKKKETEPSRSDRKDYNMDNYDEEPMDLSGAMSIGNLAVYGNNDLDSESDNDSDKLDEILKPDDNLVIVGNVKKSECLLEVYVYNGNDQDFYIHHDIMLKNPPLCLEWFGIYGNFCALGSMSAMIDVWDLDLMGCVHPSYR